MLVGLLPPLLYAAALRTSLFDFGSNRRAIGLLSVGYVIFGTVTVGLVVWWLFPEIPLAAAMALGAVVAPPDAVAATAIARKVGMPRRIVTILEGESLVNDATALVCLRAAIAAIAGTVSAAGIAGGFLLAAGGGLVVGLAAAYVLTELRKRIRNVAINTSTSLMAPFVAYLPAEAIHASGVLAVVVTGLVMGTKAPSMPNGAARLSQRSNWHTVQFLLENSVFLLIGLQVRTIIEGVQDDSLGAGRIWARLRRDPAGGAAAAPGLGLPGNVPAPADSGRAAEGSRAALAVCRDRVLGRHARRGDACRRPGAAGGPGAPVRADPGRPRGGGRHPDAAGLHAAGPGPAAAGAGPGPARGRAEPGLADAAGHRRRGAAAAGTALATTTRRKSWRCCKRRTQERGLAAWERLGRPSCGGRHPQPALRPAAAGDAGRRTGQGPGAAARRRLRPRGPQRGPGPAGR